jgi:chemotaxis protein methyltransferase CheR
MSHFDTADLTEKEFRVYQEFLLGEFGIRLADSKIALVRGRLAARIRKLGIGNYGDYLKHALDKGNPEERAILIDRLTTHETRFFRDLSHYQWLSENLQTEGWPLHKLRVWSAACSTGEEAYSIAMTLLNSSERSAWEILGTDVSQGSVEKAVTAVYDVKRESDIPDDYLKRFCLKGVGSMNGYFTINEKIQKNVTFRPMNLMSPDFDTGIFDIVFLNNVLIYFDQNARRSTVQMVIDRIRPGGHLIVGASESLNGVSEELQWIRQSIYRKRK